MGTGMLGAKYQCWLPYRSSAADSSWRPKEEDWVRLNCSENPMSLSANASDVVVPSHNLKLRDVLPRRARIFMSHTFLAATARATAASTSGAAAVHGVVLQGGNGVGGRMRSSTR